MLQITDDLTISLSEISFTYVRSSGPGGQNVNKVSSKAVMRWNLSDCEAISPEVRDRFMKLYPSYVTREGEVVLTSQESRDAPKNRLSCLNKLTSMLQKALKKPKERIPTKPTRTSIRRRLENKARQSEKKDRRKFSHDE